MGAEWAPNLTGGIPGINTEYSAIADLLRRLTQATEASDEDRDQFMSVLDEVVGHFEALFALEARYSRTHPDVDSTLHLAEHERLRVELLRLKDSQSDVSIGRRNLGNYLRVWLATHSAVFDRVYGAGAYRGAL